MTPKELFDAGRLDEAIEAVQAQVKGHPADLSVRGLLCELLCFAGQLDRADTQLDMIGHQDAQSMLGVALFRQLIRAELARRQFFAEGRLPEFLGQPSPRLQLHLQASIALREGHPAEAEALLGDAEGQRVAPSGTCNGQPFDDLRDLDDLTSSFFEVLTSTGKYYWVPIEQVESVEFRRPARPRDLFWREAHMIVRGGPDGEVYLPALYVGSDQEADGQLRLGRSSDWRGGEGAPVRGVGQRSFLVGEQDLGILELETLTIGEPS